MSFVIMQKRRVEAALAGAPLSRAKRRALERLVLRAAWDGFEAGHRHALAGGKPLRFWQLWRWLW